MDKKKLLEKINAIPSVCKDGKKAIIEVFEAALDVELKEVPVEFKVGDLVECIEPFGKIDRGMKGVIVHINNYYPEIGVKWIGLTNGHSCNGHCPEGMGYYVKEEHLKSLEISNTEEGDDYYWPF